MKLLACAAMSGSLWVFHRLAGRFGFGPWEAAFATVLLAFTITPFHEAFNGMEMNFSTLLLLLLLDLLLSGKRGLEFYWRGWLVSGVLIATRFESPYMLAATLIGCVLSRRSDARVTPVRQVLLLAVLDAVLFLLLAIWRHSYFGL